MSADVRDDAQALERAVSILRARAAGKRSFMLDVLCKILADTAAKIRAESS